MIRLAIGLFFIVLPFLELVLLIKTSSAIGFWLTLLLMLGAAIVGGMVLTRQSAGAFRQALEATSRGQTPHAAVLDGMFLMVAGVLLIVPGLITDAMGLALLIPPLRRWVARKCMSGMIWSVGPIDDDERSGSAPRQSQPGPRSGPAPGPTSGRPPGRPDGRGPVIEGEFERLDEHPKDPDRPRDRRS